MKLKIGNFHVKDIQLGMETSFKNGMLTVNEKEAIAYMNRDGKLKNIKLYVVKPGESVRMVPVKSVVEPRFRPDGRSIFPGYTGPVEKAGDGVLYALRDMGVILCGKYSEIRDGIIDMSGPAAKHSHYSQMTNLVAYAERVNEKDLELTIRNEDELRLASCLLSEYVGKAVAEQNPEYWDIFELEAEKKEENLVNLPRVAYFAILVSQLENGCNDMIYGQDCHNMLSVLMHPNEVLDGAIVPRFGAMGQGSSAYTFQNNPVIKRMYAEHGKTLNFVGVIAVPSDVSDDIKRRVQLRSGQIASSLELDGAIIAEWGGGSNLDVDFFYHLAELEDQGIKTVGLMSEHGGKMMQDPKGDAIVSGGDTNEIIELPPMDLVIGDLESVVRDSYYGSWPVHETYGPSLRDDGSLIINLMNIGESGNITGFLKKTVKEY